MSKQQLESILAVPSSSKLTLKPKKCTSPKDRIPSLKPKNLTPTPPPRLEKTLSIPNDYKPKKIPSTLDDNCIKYENESNEKPTITEYLENIRPYYGICQKILKQLINEKFISQ